MKSCGEESFFVDHFGSNDGQPIHSISCFAFMAKRPLHETWLPARARRRLSPSASKASRASTTRWDFADGAPQQSSAAVPSAAVPFSQPPVEEIDSDPLRCAFKTTRGERCQKACVGSRFCSMHKKVLASDKIDRAWELLAKQCPDHRLAPQALERWML